MSISDDDRKRLCDETYDWGYWPRAITRFMIALGLLGAVCGAWGAFTGPMRTVSGVMAVLNVAVVALNWWDLRSDE